MGTRKTRREKVEWMEKRIDDFFKRAPAGESIALDSLLADFAYENASSERTGLQIIQMLSRATGKFRISKNEVFK